jgi:hypothetical protein
MSTKSMKGGAGVSEWGVKTYGGINSQGPANDQDNTIKMSGGKKEKGGCWKKGGKTMKKKRGGSLIGELAAPIILLTAQQNYKSRRSMKNFRKNRKSRSYRRK